MMRPSTKAEAVLWAVLAACRVGHPWPFRPGFEAIGWF